MHVTSKVRNNKMRQHWRQLVIQLAGVATVGIVTVWGHACCVVPCCVVTQNKKLGGQKTKCPPQLKLEGK